LARLLSIDNQHGSVMFSSVGLTFFRRTFMKFRDICMPEFNQALQPLYQSVHLSSEDWLKIADVVLELQEALEPFKTRLEQLKKEFTDEKELEAKFQELVDCDCKELPKIDYAIVEKAKGVSLVHVKILKPVLLNIPEKIAKLMG